MEKNFIRVRSVKDIIICTSLIIMGSACIALPTSASINILGFFTIFAGLLLLIFMKTGYKDENGLRYCKEEMYFDKSKQSELSRKIAEKICASDIKDENIGNGIRLDIYYNKSADKSYVQLYEYVPYKYEPCSCVYEHTYDCVSEIIR